MNRDYLLLQIKQREMYAALWTAKINSGFFKSEKDIKEAIGIVYNHIKLHEEMSETLYKYDEGDK